MQKLIELLESELGYAERSGGYTKFGDWYGKTVEFDADYTAAPWCDMYLSWAAWKLGYQDWVGQFAYTVYHAQWFKEQDAWGTVPKPGALVFFDWSGSKKISKIDHVGIVTKVVGNKIHTIEGNIDGGVAKRKVRDTDKVVGYGYPEKVKIRLEREASEKQVVVKPADAGAGNSVQLSSGPNLLSMMPPGTVRESLEALGADTKPAPKHARSASRPAEGTAASTSSGTTAQSTRPDTKDTAGARGSESPTPTPAPAAGRTGSGKHAKPAAADTNAVVVTPTATAARDITSPAADLGSPGMLAPVLLAAVAILATAKAKQSKTRLAFAAAGGASAAPSRRTPGRRAPGRRRRTAVSLSAPVSTHELHSPREVVATTTLTPAGAAGFPSLTTAAAHVEETTGTGRTRGLLTGGSITAGTADDILTGITASAMDDILTGATTGTMDDVLGGATTDAAQEALPAGVTGDLLAGTGAERDVTVRRLRDALETDQTWDAFATVRTQDAVSADLARAALGAGHERDALAPAAFSGDQMWDAFSGGASAGGDHARDTAVPGRGRGAFDAQRPGERPRAPYQGRRRRLQERSAAGSPAFVQDAPLRGRRHRRADAAHGDLPVTPSRSTTASARPRRAGTGPVAPAVTAVPAGAAPPAAPALAGRRHRRAAPAGVTTAVPAAPAAVTGPAAEPDDVPVHGGYRGRRRAGTRI
ncbi:hypothetical protein FHS43_003617 [Streptosporangium becharense]|uniref:Peptidase C51 domain-containing protein n=1 Tax=Streptosporangium becharense TaxID=1816182 RepID=A0A7W9IDS4_9ACTN|nr:CHAP domain-containing protein [Streptosporangium becharense]MBB2912337.1 hypothetical protein [Streptosporangium becharense]MBB5818884.1 hypothetical protein [Streptosporangium becharense]